MSETDGVLRVTSGELDELIAETKEAKPTEPPHPSFGECFSPCGHWWWKESQGKWVSDIHYLSNEIASAALFLELPMPRKIEQYEVEHLPKTMVSWRGFDNWIGADTYDLRLARCLAYASWKRGVRVELVTGEGE